MARAEVLSPRSRLCCTVLRPIPSTTAISRTLVPPAESRSICRMCRMVSLLIDGMKFPSWIQKSFMPRLLTRRHRQDRKTVR